MSRVSLFEDGDDLNNCELSSYMYCIMDYFLKHTLNVNVLAGFVSLEALSRHAPGGTSLALSCQVHPFETTNHGTIHDC